MKELYKRVVWLNLFFALFVALPIIYIGLTEYGFLDLRFDIADTGVQYNYEIVGVLATLLVVPSSLKLFNWMFNKKVDGELQLQKAMSRYFWLSVVRLFAIFVVAMYNIVLYYSVVNSNIGMLCFFICIVAYMFCIPGRQKMESDLHIDKMTEE